MPTRAIIRGESDECLGLLHPFLQELARAGILAPAQRARVCGAHMSMISPMRPPLSSAIATERFQT